MHTWSCMVLQIEFIFYGARLFLEDMGLFCHYIGLFWDDMGCIIKVPFFIFYGLAKVWYRALLRGYGALLPLCRALLRYRVLTRVPFVILYDPAHRSAMLLQRYDTGQKQIEDMGLFLEDMELFCHYTGLFWDYTVCWQEYPPGFNFYGLGAPQLVQGVIHGSYGGFGALLRGGIWVSFAIV